MSAQRNNCVKLCNNIGAFKKSPVSPNEALGIANKEAKVDGTAETQPLNFIEPIVTGQSPSTEEHLPGLKPDIHGNVNWTPLADMTGTRPRVNKYSLSRYSLDEWRRHNQDVLNDDLLTESNTIDYNAKTEMMRAFGIVDKYQQENNKRLKQKARDIFRWKTEVKRACEAITQEVELLEIERQRLKGAARCLMIPESISKECLELRSNRYEPDLVADLAEQELIKEMNLVGEVRATLKATLQKLEEQQAVNKAVKHRIEYDYCDKEMAYQTDTANIGLNPKSNTILFRPGATKYGENSAPLEYWEYYCRENIRQCEAARQNSVDLRGSLNAILTNGGRKLRTQADRTDMALAETVAINEELLTKLEDALKKTLQNIADIENLIDSLRQTVSKMDAAMKLAQTRLDNRNNGRPHGECVRDQTHIGLIEEVSKIHETVTGLFMQIKNAERMRKELMEKRTILEKDIASKRKVLNTDRDRCGLIRSHYPSASELAGF